MHEGSFLFQGTARSLGDLTIAMVMNHWTKSWDDPPSIDHKSIHHVPHSSLGLVGIFADAWMSGVFNPFEKYARQIGSCPQVGLKTNMFANHHLEPHWVCCRDELLPFWTKLSELGVRSQSSYVSHRENSTKKDPCGSGQFFGFSNYNVDYCDSKMVEKKVNENHKYSYILHSMGLAYICLHLP